MDFFCYFVVLSRCVGGSCSTRGRGGDDKNLKKFQIDNRSLELKDFSNYFRIEKKTENFTFKAMLVFEKEKKFQTTFDV